jgi:DNA-directed RNA polymerase III subunit RPC1
MAVDPRHVMLLGDVMTYRGEIDGINRVGVAKIKDSILHKASFERTVDHLFDAAAYGKVDAIEGVTASIVMGIPMTLGTGSFDLRSRRMELPPSKVPLFESHVGECLS